ncbi:MAG: NAD-dependent malic enzyme, partial [Verrucomicrobiota bacterium]
MNHPISPDDGGLQPHGGPLFRRGTALLNNSLLNKGTGFSEAEREALGLRGLLPPRVFTLEEQAERALRNLHRKPDALEKYIYLTTLQNRNETLFYR